MPSSIQGPQFQAQPWRTLPVTYPASAPTPLSALSGTITDDFNRTDYVFPVTQQSGSNSIDAPAGLVAGDLILLVICTGAGGVFSAGPSGGWTLVSELTNALGAGFDCRARLYYRTATSADIATTYTWTTTAGSVHAALTAYRGATGISTTTTGTTGTADSYTAPTTTTASNELMVTVFAAATDSTSANTTRFTTNAPIDEVLATSNFFHCGVTDDVDLGRTTAVTATMTAGYHPSWVSWTLAIAGVRRTVPSLGAPWVPVTHSTDPKSLGSVFGIIGGRAQALHDDGVFGATYPSEVYVKASLNGTLDYDFASYFSNDAVLVRYDAIATRGYAVSGTVVIAPDGSTVTNTLTGGLGYVNGSWSGLSGHARIVVSGTDLDVYRDGVHEFHGVMSSNLDRTRFAIQATTGVTFWDNFAWTTAPSARGWVVGAIGWGGSAATSFAFVDAKSTQHTFGLSYIDADIPTTGNVGDLLILIHSGFNDTSDPTGWTAIPDIIASGTSLNCRLSVWTRIADGTETGVVRLTDSADSDVTVGLRYSGVGSYTDTTWSSTNVADSITTPTASANAGDIVVSIWAWEEINTSAPLTVTTDGAVTARIPKVQWDQACLAVGDETAATTGTTTGRTATATNANSGASRCAMTIVLSP